MIWAPRWTCRCCCGRLAGNVLGLPWRFGYGPRRLPRATEQSSFASNSSLESKQTASSPSRYIAVQFLGPGGHHCRAAGRDLETARRIHVPIHPGQEDERDLGARDDPDVVLAIGSADGWLPKHRVQGSPVVPQATVYPHGHALPRHGSSGFPPARRVHSGPQTPRRSGSPEESLQEADEAPRHTTEAEPGDWAGPSAEPGGRQPGGKQSSRGTGEAVLK